MHRGDVEILRALFDPKGNAAGENYCFSAIEKGERLFLLLPPSGSMARATLRLYSPQKFPAQLAAILARLVVGWLPWNRIQVALDLQSDWLIFLWGAKEVPVGKTPFFGMFFGNPRAEGARFLFPVFRGKGRASVLVKAGIHEEGRRKILQEAGMLKFIKARNVLAGNRGRVWAPEILEEFDDGKIAAFAMNYLRATQFSETDGQQQLPRIFGGWLDTDKKVPIRELDEWKELAASLSDLELRFPELARLGDVFVHPSLVHGDFAPWNLKVDEDSGNWWILDWERGKAEGMPGLDWIHFIIQPRLLTRNRNPRDLWESLLSMLTGEPFQKFLYQCGVGEAAREWVLFYLLHQIEVIRPTEGRETLRQLLPYARIKLR